MIAFGLDATDLEDAARTPEALLRVQFTGHESGFRGGDYYRADTPVGALLPQRNFDPVDSETFENEWPADRLILYLDGTEDDTWSVVVETLTSAGTIRLSRLGL